MSTKRNDWIPPFVDDYQEACFDIQNGADADDNEDDPDALIYVYKAGEIATGALTGRSRMTGINSSVQMFEFRFVTKTGYDVPDQHNTTWVSTHDPAYHASIRGHDRRSRQEVDLMLQLTEKNRAILVRLFFFCCCC